MNIAHHPSPEMLLSYAAGATREASALLVATHLALCPECRKTVAAAESAGGAMLGAESAAMSDGAFDALLGRLDETQPETKKNVPGDIPEPLRSYVGANLCDLRWQMVAPGIWQIPFLKQGKTRARLLKVAHAGSCWWLFRRDGQLWAGRCADDNTRHNASAGLRFGRALHQPRCHRRAFAFPAQTRRADRLALRLLSRNLP